MTDLIPITCEARIMGFSKQSRADGDWTELRIHIHPDETPHSLFLLPLKTHIKLSISGPDETTTEDAAEPAQTQTAPETVEDAPRLKGGERARRAGILCDTEAFQIFIANKWPDLWQANFRLDDKPSDTTAMIVRFLCAVKSRAELDWSPTSAKYFDDIESAYRASQPGETDEDMATQLAGGPS